MDESTVIQYIEDTFPDVVRTEAMGYSFFFYGEERMTPFATIAHGDNEYDSVSKLDRGGYYRLNIGVSRKRYRELFGDERPRLGPEGILEGDHDFTALDTLFPHPHYAPQSWLCVINPSATTFERVKPLLAEAYERAIHRAERHTAPNDESDS